VVEAFFAVPSSLFLNQQFGKPFFGFVPGAAVPRFHAQQSARVAALPSGLIQ
jgi:hypothetical protein